jgi:diadenosine tetraphosphate (Ap4A) HIT family hydrolase
VEDAVMDAASGTCELCTGDGGLVVLREGAIRVVLVEDPAHPGFCRVVWEDHVAEMTDLAPVDRDALMALVFRVEAALRRVLRPDKVNLLSSGNRTPHLHWHVVPRYRDDPEFPGTVFGPACRPSPGRELPPGFGDELRRLLSGPA